MKVRSFTTNWPYLEKMIKVDNVTLILIGIFLVATPTKKQMLHLSPKMPAMSADHLGSTSLGNIKLQKLFFHYVI